MNHDTLAISERYKANINPVFILQESFSDLYKNNAIAELQEWYDYDVRILNDILVQEGLGDMIKNAGSKIGTAVKGVGNFALKQLATALGKVLKMAMPSEEEAQKLQQEAEKLKDKGYLDQQAAAGNKLLGGGGSSEASEEMYENTRRFLLSTVFSESNLIKLFNTQLLAEAKAGRPKGNKSKEGKVKTAFKPAGKVATAGGTQQKANMAALDPAIMELISIVQQMKSGRQKQALNRIARTIGKKTKLQFPTPFPKADKQLAQQQSQGVIDQGQQGQASSQNSQLANTDTGELATTGQGGQLASASARNQIGRRSGPPVVDAEFTDVPNDQQALPSGQSGDTKSLFQKVMGYVKAHPRITSSIAIALIAAVTAASGGTLLPLVVAGLSSGGIKAGVTAYQTNKEEGKVNWDKTVDSLFKGAAIGAGGAAVGQGVKGLMGGGAPSTSGNIKPIQPQAGNADALNNWDGQANTDTQSGSNEWDGTEGDLPAPTAEVGADLFKKYNATSFNPNSPMDQAKKQIMQKLSDANNGQIPASQYNDLAKKAAQLIKQGTKPNSIVSQLFPESYTVNYLRFF